jgi:cytoskeletal protein CcmA (bactofilin family)
MLLIGVLNPTSITPSFVVPLFQEPGSDVFYIQRFGAGERIKSFESFDLSDQAKAKILWLDPDKRRQVVGVLRFYAFLFKNNDFIVGNNWELKKLLIERLNEVNGDEHPFILTSIAKFIGDVSLRASAEARARVLLNNESPSARERWRNIFASTDNPLGIPPTKQGPSTEAENEVREASSPSGGDSTRASVMADIPNKNSLANDVEIKGSIKFDNELAFDGIIEGAIISDGGILTVGETGSVKGEVRARSVIVMGRVIGNITVQERCELRSNSQLIGDLRAARLILEEGSTFVGKSVVSPNRAILKQFEPQQL